MIFATNATEALAVLAHLWPAIFYQGLRPDISIHPPSNGVVIGTLLTLLGTLIRVASYRQLGRHFTFHLSIKKDHRLITDGPYSIVRHPSYSGGLLFFIGAVMSQLASNAAWRRLGLWGNPVGFVFGAVQLSLLVYIGSVLVFWRVPKEDAMLREQFKDEWEAWAERTRYKLIPYVY